MEDLIYNFLLQSDFPRASILTDPDILESNLKHSRDPITPPSFVIVDPDTAKPLAVIEVVDDIDDETLRDVAIRTRGYASRLAGRAVQGFVIRVDIHAVSEADQVRFYRIWPASSLQRLTSKNFPDLDTLRVARKLADGKTADVSVPQPVIAPVQEPQPAVVQEVEAAATPGFGMYFPAILLLALVLVDSYFTLSQGTPLLSLTQSVLVIGAATLFTLPAAIRYLRR